MQLYSHNFEMFWNFKFWMCVVCFSLLYHRIIHRSVRLNLIFLLFIINLFISKILVCTTVACSMPILPFFLPFHNTAPHFVQTKGIILINKSINKYKSLDISHSNDPIQIAYSLIKVLDLTHFCVRKKTCFFVNQFWYKCFIYNKKNE